MQFDKYISTFSVFLLLLFLQRGRTNPIALLEDFQGLRDEPWTTCTRDLTYIIYIEWDFICKMVVLHEKVIKNKNIQNSLR